MTIDGLDGPSDKQEVRMVEARQLPRPYLTPKEVEDRMIALGFQIGKEVLDYPPGFQTEKFHALQELIAGAIAEWADVKDDLNDEQYPMPADHVNQELLEFAEEYLIA